ncbi:hypothetical protein ACHAWF_002907 [Thalassiosira exigua]
MEAEWTTYTGVEDFRGRADIVRVRVAPNVKAIKDAAFWGCPRLREVDLGNVVSIGNSAFYVCSNLVRVRFPPTVVEMGDAAFGGCRSLVEVELCEGLRNIGKQSFSHCMSLKRISVPSTVAEIGDDAFRECPALSEVTPCEGLKMIGNMAFLGCKSLESVTFPSTVAIIGKKSFCYCRSLRAVYFGEGIHHIGAGAFGGSSSLLHLDIPPNAFVIEWGDVPNCRFVENFIAPSTVEVAIVCAAGEIGIPAAQTIVSGKLGKLSPHSLAIVKGQMDAILGRQDETMEEKVEMIRAFIAHYKMVDATTTLELAIRKVGLDVRGEQDVESIIIRGVLPYFRSENKWVYL